MKKILSILSAAAMIVSLMCGLAVTSFAEEGDFVLESDSVLPDAYAYAEYWTQIKMQGGNDGYTFELVSNSPPSGLDFTSSDFTDEGIIHGYPTTQGLYADIEIKITKGGMVQPFTFSIYIVPRQVNVVPLPPFTAVYDGKPHGIEVECYDYNDKEMTTPIHATPIVRYNGQLEAINNGIYTMVIDVPGCTVMNTSPDWQFTITKATASVSIVDQTFGYSGETHNADYTVSPSTVERVVEYKLQGTPESEYSTAAPSEAGVYDVRVRVTDQNYNPISASAVITITEGAANFEASYDYTDYEVSADGNTVTFPYTGEPIETSVRSTNVTELEDGVNYEWTYKKKVKVTGEDGTETETEIDVKNPTDAGSYELKVTMKEGENYTVGSIDPYKLVITPEKVDFNIDFGSEPFVYGENVPDGTETVTPVGDSLFSGNVTLKYADSRGNAIEGYPKNAGIYIVSAEVDNANFTPGTVTPSSIMIRPRVTVNDGNSPASAEIAEQWAEHISGIDYAGFKIAIDGEDISPDSMASTAIVKDMVNYISAADKGMLLEYSEDRTTKVVERKAVTPLDSIDPNLYMITYTYTLPDGTESEEYDRYVMVVGKTGDANGDGYINMLDSNAIDAYTTPGAPLGMSIRAARVYDVNKDNAVNSSDADCIRKRFANPIVQYYPWVWE